MSQSQPADANSWPPLAVPVPEAARMCGVSTRTIWHVIRAGDLRPARIGKRTLVLVDDLRAWLLSRRDGRPAIPGRAMDSQNSGNPGVTPAEKSGPSDFPAPACYFFFCGGFDGRGGGICCGCGRSLNGS